MTKEQRRRKPKYEVADVFRIFIDDDRAQYATTGRQEEVIRAILACRTAEMGGVVYQCEDCGAVKFVLRACGDSHCPKCGKFRKAQWVARQEKLVLPVPYFHVTFTTDHAINGLLPGNRKVLLDGLFWSVSKTLKEFGEKYLSGHLGITAVLHTWGQDMGPHVHIHCIVTGGALSKDGEKFRKSGKKYLFDAKKLSARFRDRFCRKIRKLYRQRKLKLVGKASELDVEKMVQEMLDKNWEVFIKAFEAVENLYQYLSRYVHQVAISNTRILKINRWQKTVTFRWKDNKDGGKEKEMTLSGVDFIWRFLWHVLLRGFWRIRHYGLHHGSCRSKLSQARKLLGAAPEVPEVEALSLRDWLTELLGADVLNQCPHCGGQTMFRQGQYEAFNFLQLLLVGLAMLCTSRRAAAAAS